MSTHDPLEKLKTRPQWVLWKLIPKTGKPGKFDKVPHRITGEKASITNPEHWSSYDRAANTLALSDDFTGVGYCFTKDDPFVFIDLDDCFLDDNAVRPQFKNLVDENRSFMELSQSHRGMHIIVEGEIPKAHVRRFPDGSAIEFYDHSRFVAMTEDFTPWGRPQPVRRPPDGWVERYYKGFGGGNAADYLSSNIPTIDEDELRTLTEIGVSRETVDLIYHGEGAERWDEDKSKILWFVATELLNLDATPAEVLYYLTIEESYLGEAGWRRRQSLEGARAWTWQYIVDRAKQNRDALLARLRGELPTVEGASPFEDLSEPAAARDTPGGDSAPTPGIAPIPHPADDLDPARIPPRQWVLGHRFQPGQVTGGFADAGTGKSIFAMITAAAIATGRPLTGETVHRPGPVWIINNEEPLDELRRRLAAVLIWFEIPFKEIAGKILLSSGMDDPLLRLVVDAGGQTQVNADAGKHIIRTARASGVRHIVLDPLISLHSGLSENDASKMEDVLSVIRQVAHRGGVSVDLVHHIVKSHTGDTEGRAGDMHSGRGSAAITGALRCAYTMARMSEKRGKALFLSPNESARYVRVDDAKANYHAFEREAAWYKFESINLTNGDSVGVLAPVNMAELEERAEALRQQGAIEEAGRLLRYVTTEVLAAGEPLSVSAITRQQPERLFEAVGLKKSAVEALITTLFENDRTHPVTVDDREFRVRMDGGGGRGGRGRARMLAVEPVENTPFSGDV